MHVRRAMLPALVLITALVPLGCASMREAGPLKVVSERTVKGFAFPESVGCDAQAKVLYVSEFGSELKPAEKDGKGRISRVSLNGDILDKQVFPAAGGEVLHKPKGIWIAGNRLWVTDIDSVWIFDLQSRRGKKLALPGVVFANDPTVAGNVLYVSDNRSDQVVRVEPADFLETSAAPRITSVFKGRAVNPNGLYPAKDGSILIVGFMAPDQPRGIYALQSNGEIKTMAQPMGRLDGVYDMGDGTLLVTDWNSGSLLRWGPNGTETLAKGFKGPADFCVLRDGGEWLVAVPDLVASELRLVRLGR